MKLLFSLISFPISLEWGGKTVTETVYWFQYEQDPSLNSNVYDVASKLVQKHFPGEFGSERLVQKVVDIILRQTARREGENKGLQWQYLSLILKTDRKVLFPLNRSNTRKMFWPDSH